MHSNQAIDDAQFWERLHDMPAWEAEQECVMRRERLVLQNAMLTDERRKLLPLGHSTQRQREHKHLGQAIVENNAQLAKLNDHTSYLRRLQDKIQWKEAVIHLFGTEGYEQCQIYMEQQWGEIRQQRRDWGPAVAR